LTIGLLRGAGVAVVLLFGLPQPLPAIDPARLPPEAVDTATVSPAAFLERLERIEKSLSRMGAPPLFAKRPKVIPLTDAPTLLSTNNYGSEGVPYFGVFLQLLNTTGTVQTLDPTKVVLTADGRRTQFKDVPKSIRGFMIDIGGRNVSIEEALPSRPISLAPGKVTSVLMAFAPVEARGKVPPLTLHLEIRGESIDVDLNHLHRALLNAESVRIGPEGACGLVTIRGAIDGLNAGELSRQINDLSEAGVRRFVVAFDPGASAPTLNLAGWLASMAVDGEINALYRALPGLPTSVAELHFAGMPKEVSREYLEASRGEEHGEVEQAIVASLWAPYRGATRATVLRELEQGDPRGRAAALACGGHVFRETDLARLLKWIDDPSHAVRSWACADVARLDSDAARLELQRVIREGSPRTAEAALTAMLRARAASNIAAGIAAAQGPTSIPDVVLLRILIDSQQPVFHDRIRQAARSGSGETRLLALAALGSSRFLNANDVFEDAFAAPEQQVRDTALSAAAARMELGDQRLRSLVIAESLRRLEANPGDAIAASMATRTRDPRFVPVLAARLSNPSSPQERKAVVERLAQIGGDAATAELIKHFDSLSSSEQETALSHIWMEDPALAFPLAEKLIGSSDATLSEEARQVLVQDASDRAVAAIRQAVKGQGPAYRGELLQALATIGSPAAYDALFNFRETGNASMREQADLAFAIYWSRSPAHDVAEQGIKTLHQHAIASPAAIAESMRLFNTAIEIDPLLPKAYQGRGNARIRLELWKEAARDFEAALELNPADDIALTGLLLSKVMLGRDVEAIEWLAAAAPRFPDRIDYSYNSACVYARALEMRLKQPASPERDAMTKQYRDAAFEHLDKSLELNSTRLDVLQLELLENDPDLLSLHSDPRFTAAVKKLTEALKE
jgi:tetratricopeptide (TPR) repeat protein